MQHAQSPEDAEHLVAHGTAIFGTGPLFCTQVGPVLGAHLGSGVLVGGIVRRLNPDLSRATPAERRDDRRHRMNRLRGCMGSATACARRSEAHACPRLEEASPAETPLATATDEAQERRPAQGQAPAFGATAEAGGRLTVGKGDEIAVVA